jgi:hypothetical protein
MLEYRKLETKMIAQDQKHLIDPDEIWDKDSLKSDKKVEEHHADP